jgi:hypothetical protein
MLNISKDPFRRFKEKLKCVKEQESGGNKDLFEIKNEVFIAYCEEIPLKEIVEAIDNQINSEKVRNDLKKYLKKIVEKGADYYDRRRCKKNHANGS